MVPTGHLSQNLPLYLRARSAANHRVCVECPCADSGSSDEVDLDFPPGLTSWLPQYTERGVRSLRKEIDVCYTLSWNVERPDPPGALFDAGFTGAALEIVEPDEQRGTRVLVTHANPIVRVDAILVLDPDCIYNVLDV